MPDPRFPHDVGNIPKAELPAKLRAAMDELQRRFPGLGLTLFVFEFGGPGGNASYISNANRGDMVTMVEKWVRAQRAGMN